MLTFFAWLCVYLFFFFSRFGQFFFFGNIAYNAKCVYRQSHFRHCWKTNDEDVERHQILTIIALILFLFNHLVYWSAVVHYKSSLNKCNTHTTSPSYIWLISSCLILQRETRPHSQRVYVFSSSSPFVCCFCVRMDVSMSENTFYISFVFRFNLCVLFRLRFITFTDQMGKPLSKSLKSGIL